MSSVTTKPRVSDVRKVMSVVWTQRLSFASTAAATRKVIAQRQSKSIENVCAAQAQSRDLNYCGLKTYAKVLTDNCCEFNWRGCVQEEKL